MPDKVDELLSQMTVEEKISMLAGADMWHTLPVKRLGIPSIKVSDGPNGARGGGDIFSGGITSACFPAGIGLASTWDVELIEQVGEALAEEVKSKGAHFLLAPTVNIHRTPLGGRNFESYSEDPYLAARMAVAYITGLQKQNVGATVKHYACNDSEFERNTISSEVGERALREIYLPPFRAAVQEAKTWAAMASYNKVNGTYAGENPYLLEDILRREWGFEGLVMSDWFGTKSSVEALNAGLDLEMPGPTGWRGEKIIKAYNEGKVKLETIDKSVRRILEAILKAGAFDYPEETPEQAIDKPELRTLIRRAAAEGMVLLKNANQLLPLDNERLNTIALIGPNARTAQIMGGGSAHVNPHYTITPYQGIINKVGNPQKANYEIGCTNFKLTPLLDMSWVTPAQGEAEKGLTAEFFNNADLSGTPVWTILCDHAAKFWAAKPSPEITTDFYSIRFRGKLTPPESGVYTFSLVSTGKSRLYLDGKEIIENWEKRIAGGTFFGMGSTEVTGIVELVAGQVVDFRVEFARHTHVPFVVVRLGCMLPFPADSIERAVALAARSDVALVFAGLSDEWESEGFDRTTLELPGDQNLLIEKVAHANPKTIVVLTSGSALSMPWLPDVAAVLQAWYPGQECGNAIADVLFGDVNPCGKLPQTFPVRLEDTPAYINYPGENGKVVYGEGIFVGYRYYEKKKVQPLFPFGFGLSYTSFDYGPVQLSTTEMNLDEDLQVSIEVKNAGSLSGKEIVQLYVRDPQSSLVRPVKELKKFAKLFLQPSESRTVTFTVTSEDLAFYDDHARQWVAEEGDYELLLGSSSQNIHSTATFKLMETQRFGKPVKTGLKLSIESPIYQLLANDEAKAILQKHVPGFLDAPQLTMAMNFSLAQVAGYASNVFTPQVMEAISKDLESISPVTSAELPKPPKLNFWQRLLVKIASRRSQPPGNK